MRNLISWISVLFNGLLAQTLTFVLTGIGCGYALMVLQMYKLKRAEVASEIFGLGTSGMKMGVSDSDWNGFIDAITAGQFHRLIGEMPVIGWYFLIGFCIGGFLSIIAINIATFIHVRRLAKGGEAMAEKLGAFPFDVDTVPGNLKKLPALLNDLAADFELPVPKLFILPHEEGMNAFVIGRNRKEAVLVVTRGLRAMNSHQQKGIIAHELAHIHNGDMVHNMRLLAVELGINTIRHSAEWMIRIGWTSVFGGSSIRMASVGIYSGLFLFVVGLALWPMGLVSSLVGSALMANSNRGRELRTDKLAAKVLGSWAPIGDALKRTLGHELRGRIVGPDGRKLAHLMFTQANGRSGGTLATHPTLEKRIRKADREWDGIPLYEGVEEPGEDSISEAQQQTVETDDSPLAKVNPKAMELFQDPEALMLTLPSLLLFDESRRGIAAEIAGGKMAPSITAIWDLIEDTSEAQRYALMELLLFESNRNPDPSTKQLLEDIRYLAPANAWGLQCWIHMFMEAFVGKAKAVKVKHKNFQHCVRELLEIISIGVTAGNGAGLAELRFQRMWGHTGQEPMSVMPIDAYEFEDLDQSMQTLMSVPQNLREELVNGYAHSVVDRQFLGEEEAAILRYMCTRWSVTTRKKAYPGPQS